MTLTELLVLLVLAVAWLILLVVYTHCRWRRECMEISLAWQEGYAELRKICIDAMNEIREIAEEADE